MHRVSIKRSLSLSLQIIRQDRQLSEFMATIRAAVTGDHWMNIFADLPVLWRSREEPALKKKTALLVLRLMSRDFDISDVVSLITARETNFDETESGGQ